MKEIYTMNEKKNCCGKKKCCKFKFLIPVISLILFVLIRRNVKGNGAKAE